MTQFLTPVLALIIWTLIIWAIMYARRIPGMQKARIAPDKARNPDGDWKAKLPEHTQWAAHNYNHLMEQPTIFYALMFYIHLSELSAGDDMALMLAWAYVALRILHSIVQITINKVMLRFGLFSLSTIVLIWMAIRTIARVI
ncbi:MAPEG family protein [Fretibacter rubidus]|uniref:MAPEG family protein n=1 Tax=Fretibacter rubidus TaxID=570162 RepID=UPI00352A7B7A